MGEEFNSLIISCTTRTDPAAKTESIGLQADARVVMVFACHLDNFILTKNHHPSTGTLQKRMPTLTRTATNQTAGPLGCNVVPSPSARLHLDCFAAPPGQFFYFGTDS